MNELDVSGVAAKPDREDCAPESGLGASPAEEANGSGNKGLAGAGHGHHGSNAFWGMTLGCLGVVYGDIGTSPLYAFQQAILHAANHGVAQPNDILGVVSLLLWALTFICTIKYVVFLLYADNHGEGGTLSLLALAIEAIGRRTKLLFMMGAAGAALFYGDSIITPAISVLSAIEGISEITPAFAPYEVPLTIVILLGLFFAQSRGTGAVAGWFGPIMVLWFILIAGFGVWNIIDAPGILLALSPTYAAKFLWTHGMIGFFVLGSVFLAVTGAEALYADMGHFGRRPIQFAWLGLAFPALALNYMGQGALVLHHPETMADPFFKMMPPWALWGMVPLATVATVIASQAVITGAFSLTQQAVQLGLLPRFEIHHTSEDTAGQIYMPKLNGLLLLGVLLLVVVFQNSSNLAAAYGIAVTGTMVITSTLAFIVIRKVWKWSLLATLAIIAPLLTIEMTFLAANALKIFEGAYMPLMVAATIMVIMWTWVRGTKIAFNKARRESISLKDLMPMLEKSKPPIVKGTAIFLTSDPETAPAALMHNLKHNRVLHMRNIIMTVKSLEIPRVDSDKRVVVTPINEQFTLIEVTFGYMEEPNIPRALMQSRRMGVKFDIMTTSFFVGRRSFKAAADSEMPLWQDRMFIALAKSAAHATDFYGIPSGRVVELGQQINI